VTKCAKTDRINDIGKAAMMDPFAPRDAPRHAPRSPGAAPRRGRWILLIAFVAVLVVSYALVVVSIGGRDAATGEPDSPNAEQARAQHGGAGEGGEELPHTVRGDDDRGEPDPDAGASDGDRDFVREPAGSDAGPGSKAGGSGGEPGGYDPLGKGTDGPVLSETQLERAELAVSNYVSAVYGYSGDDFDEYQKQMGRAVVFPGFFSSPGAEHVREVQRQIEGSPDGVQSGALVKGFKPEEQTEKQIEGVAYFVVGESLDFSKSDPSGVRLGGETTGYAQPLNLQLYGPQWRVTAAGERQEVSD
jgi:hypothetical protein